jgi:hypothetical protein
MNLIEAFRAARRVSVPLLAIATPDPAATIEALSRDIGASVLAWDVVRGVHALNDLGRAAAESAFEDAGVTNPADLLQHAARLPKETLLFLLQAHRYLEGSGAEVGIRGSRMAGGIREITGGAVRSARFRYTSSGNACPRGLTASPLAPPCTNPPHAPRTPATTDLRPSQPRIPHMTTRWHSTPRWHNPDVSLHPHAVRHRVETGRPLRRRVRSRASEVGLGNVNCSKVRSVEDGASKPRPTYICVGQVRSSEVGALEGRTSHERPGEVRSNEPGSQCVARRQPRARKIGSFEVGIFKPCRAEVGTSEICLPQILLPEKCSVEIAVGESSSDE